MIDGQQNHKSRLNDAAVTFSFPIKSFITETLESAKVAWADVDTDASNTRLENSFATVSSFYSNIH